MAKNNFVYINATDLEKQIIEHLKKRDIKMNPENPIKELHFDDSGKLNVFLNPPVENSQFIFYCPTISVGGAAVSHV